MQKFAFHISFGMIIIQYIVHMFDVFVRFPHKVITFYLLGFLRGSQDPVIKNAYREWVLLSLRGRGVCIAPFSSSGSGVLESYKDEDPPAEYKCHLSMQSWMRGVWCPLFHVISEFLRTTGLHLLELTMIWLLGYYVKLPYARCWLALILLVYQVIDIIQ